MIIKLTKTFVLRPQCRFTGACRRRNQTSCGPQKEYPRHEAASRSWPGQRGEQSAKKKKKMISINEKQADTTWG